MTARMARASPAAKAAKAASPGPVLAVEAAERAERALPVEAARAARAAPPIKSASYANPEEMMNRPPSAAGFILSGLGGHPSHRPGNLHRSQQTDPCLRYCQPRPSPRSLSPRRRGAGRESCATCCHPRASGIQPQPKSSRMLDPRLRGDDIGEGATPIFIQKCRRTTGMKRAMTRKRQRTCRYQFLIR